MKRDNMVWALRTLLIGVITIAGFHRSAAQAIPGGFGSGDPESAPVFLKAIAANRGFVRLQVPKEISGGMRDLIPYLLSMATGPINPSHVAPVSEGFTAILMEGFEHFSQDNCRLFAVSSALALVGREPPVVVLVSEICGKVALIMRADNSRGFRISPQIEFKGINP